MSHAPLLHTIEKISAFVQSFYGIWCLAGPKGYYYEVDNSSNPCAKHTLGERLQDLANFISIWIVLIRDPKAVGNSQADGET